MNIELFLQFPAIANNKLCDGAWHNIAVLKLSQVLDCPWFFVMEFQDKEKDAQCTAIVVRMDGQFYHAVTTSHEDSFTIVGGLLTPVNPSILSLSIEAIGASFDLADLTLRMLSNGYATSRCVSRLFSPSSPLAKGSSYGNKEGQRLKYTIDLHVDDDEGSKVAEILLEDRGLMASEGTCRLATLFIQDYTIYLGKISEQKLVLTQPSREELIFILTHYFVIWRSFDYHLVMDIMAIASALDKFRAICFSEGLNVAVGEINAWSFESQQVGLLPAWIGNVAHRYSVFCQKLK